MSLKLCSRITYLIFHLLYRFFITLAPNTYKIPYCSNKKQLSCWIRISDADPDPDVRKESMRNTGVEEEESLRVIGVNRID